MTSRPYCHQTRLASQSFARCLKTIYPKPDPLRSLEEYELFHHHDLPKKLQKNSSLIAIFSAFT